MPGTRVYSGWRVIHFAVNTLAADTKWLFDVVNDAGVLDWRIEAGQDFCLTHTPTPIYELDENSNPVLDEDGNPIQIGEEDVVTGVYKPVPAAFVNWLEDIPVYDEDGVQIGTERPVVGHPLHAYDGADPWVWAE